HPRPELPDEHRVDGPRSKAEYGHRCWVLKVGCSGSDLSDASDWSDLNTQHSSPSSGDHSPRDAQEDILQVGALRAERLDARAAVHEGGEEVMDFLRRAAIADVDPAFRLVGVRDVGATREELERRGAIFRRKAHLVELAAGHLAHDLPDLAADD